MLFFVMLFRWLPREWVCFSMWFFCSTLLTRTAHSHLCCCFFFTSTNWIETCFKTREGKKTITAYNEKHYDPIVMCSTALFVHMIAKADTNHIGGDSLVYTSINRSKCEMRNTNYTYTLTHRGRQRKRAFSFRSD